MKRFFNPVVITLASGIGTGIAIALGSWYQLQTAVILKEGFGPEFLFAMVGVAFATASAILLALRLLFQDEDEEEWGEL